MATVRSSVSFFRLLKISTLAGIISLIVGCAGLWVDGKSVIENGLAQAYLIEQQSGSMIMTAKPIGLPVRTGVDGRFTLILDQGQNPESVIVEVKADRQSTMTCSVLAGCKAKGQKAIVAFGGKIALTEGFTLRGALMKLTPNANYTLNITPWSHLALVRAAAASQGLTPENKASSYRYIEHMLGLDAGALQLPPPDLTKVVDFQTAKKPALKVALMSSALLALANLPDWDNVEHALSHAVARVALTGSLAATNLGALPEVTLNELFYLAGEATRGLVARLATVTQTGALVEIAKEVYAAQQWQVTASTQVAPVMITQHPSSAIVSEYGAITFAVKATGGGNLSYQWRKDNNNIVGANSASYRLSNAVLSNQGRYSVIVSNSLGSVVSSSAALTVKPLTTQFPVTTAPAVYTQALPLSTPAKPTTVELTWDIPTARANGEPLDLFEISGYMIAYGTSAAKLDKKVFVSGALVGRHLLANLTAGQYFFAIATVDSHQLQGSYSSPISRLIL